MSQPERPVRRLNEVADLFLSGAAKPGPPAETNAAGSSGAPAGVVVTSGEVRAGRRSLVLFVGCEGGAPDTARALELAAALAGERGSVAVLHAGPDEAAWRYAQGIRMLARGETLADLPSARPASLVDGRVLLWALPSLRTLEDPAIRDGLKSGLAAAELILVSVVGLGLGEMRRLAGIADRALVVATSRPADLLRAYRFIKMIFLANRAAAVDLVLQGDDPAAARAAYARAREAVGRFLQQPLGDGGALSGAVNPADVAARCRGGLHGPAGFESSRAMAVLLRRALEARPAAAGPSVVDRLFTDTTGR